MNADYNNEKICFKKIWDESINQEYVQYNCRYPKYKFLDFLSNYENIIFHGSNVDVDMLYPSQGFCSKKKFGQMVAIYATKDSIIPIFKAILNKKRIKSNYNFYVNTKNEIKSYNFNFDEDHATETLWCRGIIYIVSSSTFVGGTDDKGRNIDEYASEVPVKPIIKLNVEPNDFPYLETIKFGLEL